MRRIATAGMNILAVRVQYATILPALGLLTSFEIKN